MRLIQLLCFLTFFIAKLPAQTCVPFLDGCTNCVVTEQRGSVTIVIKASADVAGLIGTAFVCPPPSQINYVYAPQTILSNGVWFTGQDGHVYSLDVSNGVQFITQIGSTLTVTGAVAKISSNAVLQDTISKTMRTNALFNAASAWIVSPNNTPAKVLAGLTPTNSDGTNFIRALFLMLREWGGQKLNQ